MTVSEAVKTRRSIRKFKKEGTVTDTQVRVLLESAMMAPSACNTRPWEFIVVRDRKKLDKIREAHQYTQMLETASLAIVVMALPGVQTKAIDMGYYPQDCGAATQNILLQAVELGLGTCWCGVYPKEERMADVCNALGVEGTPFCVIAVGVPDEAPEARGFFEERKVRYF